MTRPILFRSHVSPRSRSGTSNIMMRSRGSDWSHLRPYTDMDDTRDISWKKVWPTGLSTKVRETPGEYEIITYVGATPYDDFFIENSSESRDYAREKCRTLIEMSARYNQYSYQHYSGSSGLDRLVRSQPKNTLICISDTPITPEIQVLAHHNDVIYLDFVHPWEIDPGSDIMFSWQILDIKKYLYEYNSTKNILKNDIKKIQASYILLQTSNDFSRVLNTFFKNRYHHG
jgi:hypothetical protein